MIIVKAKVEVRIIALRPAIEQLAIINRPEILPHIVTTDLLKPYCKVCVVDSNMAGPGVNDAMKEIEQNANQVSNCIIHPTKKLITLN